MKKVFLIGIGLILALCLILLLKQSNSYTVEKAVQNGDFITYPEEKNRDYFDEFMTKVQKQADATIRITEYSKEGVPRVSDLEYSNQVFRLHCFYPNQLIDQKAVNGEYNELYFEPVGDAKDMFLVNTNSGDRIYICQIRTDE